MNVLKKKAITLKWLESKDACTDELRDFKEVFGTRARITRQNIVKAVNAGLNLQWVLIRLGIPVTTKCFRVGCCWNTTRAATSDFIKRYEKATGFTVPEK